MQQPQVARGTVVTLLSTNIQPAKEFVGMMCMIIGVRNNGTEVLLRVVGTDDMVAATLDQIE